MTIIAWKLNSGTADGAKTLVTREQLAELGVVTMEMSAVEEEYREPLEALVAERGYKNRDFVLLGPSIPEEKLKMFFLEHHHDDEEIRFFLSGTGFFDVRDKGDNWVRISAGAGDLIILPEGIHHRFKMPDRNIETKVMRLFKDDPKWTPVPRWPEGQDPGEDEDDGKSNDDEDDEELAPGPAEKKPKLGDGETEASA